MTLLTIHWCYTVPQAEKRMIESLIEIGLFIAKVFVVVFAFSLILGMLVRQKRSNHQGVGQVNIQDLNGYYEKMKRQLLQATGNKKKLQDYQKKNKKMTKAKAKKQLPYLFVLNFKGDINAAGAHNLSHEVSAILNVASKKDRVLVKIESPGGVVQGYGYAASQLYRLRQAGIPLTVAVDKIAASGGYMMAVVSNQIIAAPFAIVGSIGVIGQLPNFNKLLKKSSIEFEQHTAGNFKRTLTMFGENTDDARQKFKQNLQDIHDLFKNHILEYRPQVPIKKVANGDYWFAKQCLSNHLVDEIKTSDEYILEHIDSHRVLALAYVSPKRSKYNELFKGVEDSAGKALEKTMTKALGPNFY